LADATLRQRAARVHTHAEILRITRQRVLAQRLQGKQPGPEVSVQKLLGDELGQEVMALAKDLAGSHGLLTDRGPCGIPGRTWGFGYLFSRALTVGGGTAEAQRNILAERVLGLPKDAAAT